MTSTHQTPIAVIGLACRLPGGCNSPESFWRFLLDGQVADTRPPPSRFDLKGHYDGTLRPWTMRSPGGMFIDVDPKDIDAGFFGLSQVDAISMDPQQRQLLEVVYEGLENAGLSLEEVKSKLFGCFVGSYASDYSDIQTRDPEDRTPSFTVGSGRAMLSNRISHFLDIKGPSMTIDTACSGSLISVDLACRYLDSRDADGAIVAGCNLYMSPEHNMDQHAMTSAASPSGRCWTFDARADGYIKAEAINTLILKRLDDAVRDGDPIRAVIRGTSTNSDGWTPGIASPSADAQALAIRRAYTRAGISRFQDTAYLECHGTGTLAGDPIECKAASSVFSSSRSINTPLHIGSVKSNIGHSEPAAGISGMIKTILTVERGTIPGNPTFDIPNPNIDFHASKVIPSKSAIAWPHKSIRRASVNSFGYGGSNAHAIVEHPSILLLDYEARSTTSYDTKSNDLFTEDNEDDVRRLLVFSANDEMSLRAYMNENIRHLSNPAVNIKSADLAYTLSKRRTHHFYRAYAVSNGCRFMEKNISYGKLGPTPRVGFVFTGQGAQWPQMGRSLIQQFPVARKVIQYLDQSLQRMSEPPSWSLMNELTEPRSTEHMRLPEFSQPLVTALQLGLLEVLKDWGVQPSGVVGHSSGEIAAAVAAGVLSQEEAIKVAYLRGKSASDMHVKQQDEYGMLAVGLHPEEAQQYLDLYPGVRIACRNSPKSLTLSGRVHDLNGIQNALKDSGHFARLLMVNLAYHSEYMKNIATYYRTLLEYHCPGLSSDRVINNVPFFSTVHGSLLHEGCDSSYWVANMTSPVLFEQGITSMIKHGGSNFIIEIGPSGALAGPINQIKQVLSQEIASIEYTAAFHRDSDPTKALYNLAGKLFISGINVDLMKVNGIDPLSKHRVIVDLPNYQWNHSVKYWHESLSSKDWRYRPFPVHDLLGTKVLGTSWNAPSWRRILRLKNVPWVRDHMIGADVVFPASAYIAMAIEAMFQTAECSSMELFAGIQDISHASYRLRDVRFLRALVIEENTDHHLYLFLNPSQGQEETWFHFRIFTLKDYTWSKHCTGFIRILVKASHDPSAIVPLQYPTPASLWYKSMKSVGFNFGPSFQNLIEIESTHGQRTNRAKIRLRGSETLANESKYVIHPSVFDSFFQAGIPSLYQGHRTLIEKALMPYLIDEILINPSARVQDGLIAVTNSTFTTGRPDKVQNYVSNADIFNEDDNSLITKIQGLQYRTLHVPETKEISHTLMRSQWKPDISLLQTRDIEYVLHSDHEATNLSKWLHLPPSAAYLISLLGHKLANACVLDLNLCTHDQETRQEDDTTPISHFPPFRRYVSTSSTAEHLIDTQRRLQGIHGAEFHIYDIMSAGKEPFSLDAKFDLVVFRTPSTDYRQLESALNNAKRFIDPHGFLIFVQLPSHSEDIELGSESKTATPASLDNAALESFLQSIGLVVRSHSPQNQACHSSLSSVYLCSPLEARQQQTNHTGFSVVDWSNGSIECASLIQNLKDLGWAGDLLDPSVATSKPIENPLLLLDDPQSPLLANISQSSWHNLRKFLVADRKILWLTCGSQLQVSSPSTALTHGFVRSLRGESPSLILKTLDVSSFTNLITAESVIRIMETFTDRESVFHDNEYEYCERVGILHIHRVLPDEKMIRAAEEATSGADLVEIKFRQNKKTVRMHCERVGSMESLHFNEMVEQDDALNSGEVEVEIRAAGLNFKDIATTLGIVPENEHLLGLEGAGIITKVGTEVTSYRIGDRVLIHGKGSFANRNRVPKENVFLLPDSVSFEEAATISIVYFTAVFCLMEIAGIRKGQSVLIHSAAGGVGIASIQVCQYLGAKIYATVGNEDKRRFLQEQYGIPRSHIFSSRNANFAPAIRALTKGKGIDCVLNSLTGDLLDESWRLLTDNGTLVEIGKKDIMDRNTLSMEPFNRNCSYRGVDISKPSILDDLPLIERILQVVRKLLIAGHIKPISPMKVFSFSQIPEAMRYMRSGEHIGKVVISDEGMGDVRVLARPAPLSLKFDPNAMYLVVGGLKGLCGSLALYMAQCGAKNLTILSRSGVDDERSQRVIRDLSSLGATTTIFKGDVTNIEDVTRLFQESALSIKGIIQGAMVLRDKTFESMTLEEYYSAMACKVSGTWNLHAAAQQVHGKLDFFTMLSSVSGIVGTSGQANYAAGNSFQDAFALYRHSLGLVAHTVDLGIVEDVGYMSEHQSLTDRVRSRSQLPGINEKQLHDILKFSILQQTGNGGHGINQESRSQMITGLPYPLLEGSPLLGDMRFHSLLLSHTHASDMGPGSGDGDHSLRTFQSMLMASLSVDKLVPEAIKLVNKQVVRILGLATDMEESKPLSSYGIDSLAAVDLRNWLKVQLKVELTTLDILNAEDLRSLCGKVVDRLIQEKGGK